MKPILHVGLLMVIGLVAGAGCALAAPPGADDDDDAAAGAALTLTAKQVVAVGIVTAHPVAASPHEQIPAFGRVLDAASLVADLGELDGARAADRASSSEVERLRALHAGGAAASLKVVQSAQVEQAKARAQAGAQTARLGARWGALATMTPAARDALAQQLRDGRTALIRADVPGRQSLANVPESAQVQIDGVAHSARVLGVLRDGAADSPNPAVLIELKPAPPGLAGSARVAVNLSGPVMAGFLVPKTALLHDETSAHVYQQLGDGADGGTRYARRDVELLMPLGDSWLVRGVDADDAIVVRGVGLLWSMQGGAAADDDD